MLNIYIFVIRYATLENQKPYRPQIIPSNNNNNSNNNNSNSNQNPNTKSLENSIIFNNKNNGYIIIFIINIIIANLLSSNH